MRIFLLWFVSNRIVFIGALEANTIVFSSPYQSISSVSVMNRIFIPRSTYFRTEFHSSQICFDRMLIISLYELSKGFKFLPQWVLSKIFVLYSGVLWKETPQPWNKFDEHSDALRGIWELSNFSIFYSFCLLF